MGDVDNTLREAAACGDTKKVRQLLQTDSLLVNKQHNINGWTPLHWAAKRNQTSVVKILLDSGADRSIKNNSGQLAEELATSAELADVFGLEGSEETKGEENSGFVPSYLKYSQLPSYYSPEPVTVNSSNQSHMNATLPTPPTPFQVKSSQPSATSAETVLKARIANHTEQDFIEVDLDNSNMTFSGLVSLLSSELSVDSPNIIKVRKLPNTIIRNDKDVRRLRDFQEIEIVLGQTLEMSSPEGYSMSFGTLDSPSY